MSENMTIDMEKDQDKGQITYANEVISTIVSVAMEPFSNSTMIFCLSTKSPPAI